jgi:hypothetical protein
MKIDPKHCSTKFHDPAIGLQTLTYLNLNRTTIRMRTPSPASTPFHSYCYLYRHSISTHPSSPFLPCPLLLNTPCNIGASSSPHTHPLMSNFSHPLARSNDMFTLSSLLLELQGHVRACDEYGQALKAGAGPRVYLVCTRVLRHAYSG